MNNYNNYKNQVKLLLDVLPLIQEDPRFALKGGTAINLFHRDMPRLSVDIDLTYLPIEPREIFLKNLTESMQALTIKLQDVELKVDIIYSGENINKLLVSNHETTIKIEPNTILRGTVFEPEIKELVDTAQSEFLQTQKVKMVSVADLYGGKLCAALDRQHPRDVFDVKLLLENEGITTEIRQAFIVYLASGPRPMSELLCPREQNMESIFYKEFVDMTQLAFDYSNYCETRRHLIKSINHALLPNEKEFLISIKLGEPKWDLIPISHLSELPGIRWKVMNIKKMKKQAHLSALEKLKTVLGYYAEPV